MSKQITSLTDLQPDLRNARSHNPRNVGMIERALQEVGAARSIVVDEEGVVLAGNATIEAAAAAGIERVQVVDADGQTLVAVRRSGLTPEQKHHLALYDNRAAELATWDSDALAALPLTSTADKGSSQCSTSAGLSVLFAWIKKRVRALSRLPTLQRIYAARSARSQTCLTSSTSMMKVARYVRLRYFLTCSPAHEKSRLYSVSPMAVRSISNFMAGSIHHCMGTTGRSAVQYERITTGLRTW